MDGRGGRGGGVFRRPHLSPARRLRRHSRHHASLSSHFGVHDELLRFLRPVLSLYPLRADRGALPRLSFRRLPQALSGGGKRLRDHGGGLRDPARRHRRLYFARIRGRVVLLSRSELRDARRLSSDAFPVFRAAELRFCRAVFRRHAAFGSAVRVYDRGGVL